MSDQTTEQASAPALLRERQPTLRVLFAGEEGISTRPFMILDEGTTVLGRLVPAHERGLSIESDRQLSRRHAVINVGPSGISIVDAGSRNGIYVNAQRRQESELRDGDIVRLGNSFVLLRDEPVEQRDATIEGLIGRAPALRALRHAIAQVAPTRAMVLLLGESGTGKEVTARALHARSGRQGPFVAVNCAAIPESLAESQLFGHTRGAFTGATPQPGYFRAAQGGTLFLDEVGELAQTLQPKLLRALEERAVVPVGETQPVPVDVRVIAATNRVLSRSVAEGQFRGDLLARLAEFTLDLPPLRERKEDILLLLQRTLGSWVPSFHPDVVARLLAYPWPYNVREVVKLGTELQIKGAGRAVLGIDLLPARFTEAAAPPVVSAEPAAPQLSGLPASVVRSEPAASPATPPVTATSERPKPYERGAVPSKEELHALLIKHRGVVAYIAREMSRSRTQVLRWLEQRGLRADDYRSTDS
ncbi:MAG TPA: sigma 54-interacting transcriptional regulator [Pseudomonadota bacterium]|nr:sigma 54-interacting transcriptional regulator [Pseudomonadota bacterium]